jgi:hypothetical protein
MTANLLNSLIEYTTLAIDPLEKIVDLDSKDFFLCPFSYLSGHKLVQFTRTERNN